VVILPLLILCLIWVAIAAVMLTLRKQKLLRLQSHPIVAVKGVEVRYPGLPLKQYGIASRLNATSGRVQVLLPTLTEDGDVEYLYSWHYLRDVKPLDPEDALQDTTQRTAAEVLPVIRDHLAFEQEAMYLNDQRRRLHRLANLIATSSFYREQLDIYERAIDEVDRALLKARDLHKLYVRLVREALIGVQIAGYDPSNIRGDRLTFETEHRRLRDEYLYLKDLTTAYTTMALEAQLESENQTDIPDSGLPNPSQENP
jgi:hypothetical protein